MARTDLRLEELEKATEDLANSKTVLEAAVKELNAQLRRTEEQVTAMLTEMRAGFAALKLQGKAVPEDDATSGTPEMNSASTGATSVFPMPTFDGTEALAWLARAKQYFLISETSSEKREGVAMVALAGQALPWYQLLRKRVSDLPWARFARKLMKRFGGNGALDEYEAFAAIRHTGSLAAYVAAFEARLAQVGSLWQPFALRFSSR